MGRRRFQIRVTPTKELAIRVNVYAEELTDRIEIITKKTADGEFTGLRFYLELPVTTTDGKQISGPFMHGPGDDDSSAVTFFGKRDLREVLKKALALLDDHYAGRPPRQPLDEWTFEEPHFLDSEDCMGGAQRYWRVWGNRGDKCSVLGVGVTKEQAMEDAKKKAKEKTP